LSIIKEITPQMLADINWIHSCLQTMGEGFNKTITREMLGRTLEFAKGAHWQRERDLKEKLELSNKFTGIISGLRAKLAMIQSELERGFDA
jgi:hypothetical protein